MGNELAFHHQDVYVEADRDAIAYIVMAQRDCSGDDGGDDYEDSVAMTMMIKFDSDKCRRSQLSIRCLLVMWRVRSCRQLRKR